MEIFVKSTIFIILFWISVYGWGQLAVSRLPVSMHRYIGFSSAAGIVVLVFLGGMLNALHLVSSVAIFVLIVIGWLLAFSLKAYGQSLAAIKIQLKSFGWSNGFLAAPSFILILVVLLFLIATQMPGQSFNIHDDFHAYLMRPLKMLATGSLGGNPYDGAGIDSFGSQAFMQAIFLSYLPISYVNGFDSVFSYVLTAILIYEIGRLFDVNRLYRFFCVLAYFSVNLQYVNISSVSSGSLMILGMFIAVVLLHREMNSDRNPQNLTTLVILTGAFCAALISFKMTYLIFLVGTFSTYLLVLFFSPDIDRKTIVRFAAICVTTSLISVVPWLTVYFGDYFPTLIRIFQITADNSFPELLTSMVFDTITINISYLFSNSPATYGGKLIYYGLIVATAIFGIIASLAHMKWPAQINSEILPLILSFNLGSFVTFLFFTTLTPVQNGLRLSIPIIVPVFLITSILFFQYYANTNRLGRHWGYLRRSLVTFTLVFVVAAFASTTIERAERAVIFRSRISFDWALSKNYLGYVNAAVGNGYRKWIRGIQDQTKEGEAILTFHSVPFHMDFSRNKIMTLHHVSFVNPLMRIPINRSPKAMTNFLRQTGVRYLMWEYQGYGLQNISELRKSTRSRFKLLRKQGVYLLSMDHYLRSMANRFRPSYDDGRIMVIDLDAIKF